MKERILLVDDEDNLLSAVKRQLRGHFELFIAHSPVVALQTLKSNGPFAVIMSDMRMPGMNGIEFLKESSKISPNSIRIMLTGNSDQATAINAINNSQIFKFLNKPCSTETIETTLTEAIAEYKTNQLERSLLESTLQGSMQLLTEVLSLAAPELFHQATEVQYIAERLAQKLCPEDILNVRLAALFADISAIAVPKELFTKIREGQTISLEESHVIFYAIDLSKSLLNNIPRLNRVADIVYHQYKNFDGSGEPQNINKAETPIASYILRISKDYHYLRSCKGLTVPECFKILKERLNVYHPQVLQTLGSEILSIHIERNTSKIKRNTLTHQLKPGQILAEEIRTSYGLLIFAAGTRLNEIGILRIQNHARVNQIAKSILTEEEYTNDEEKAA